MGDWSNIDTTDLIYGGDAERGLVVVPRALAFELMQIVDAVESAKTWGEFRELLTPEQWETVAERRDPDVPAPADGDAFDASDLYGWDEGDYPDWPQARALDWVPQGIIDALGRRVETMWDGPYLEIPHEHERQLVSMFEARGAKIERDDGTVMRASRWV